MYRDNGMLYLSVAFLKRDQSGITSFAHTCSRALCVAQVGVAMMMCCRQRSSHWDETVYMYVATRLTVSSFNSQSLNRAKLERMSGLSFNSAFIRVQPGLAALSV